MLDWLRLIRASGLATIISNSLAAVLMVAFAAADGVQPTWLGALLAQHWPRALWVLAAGFLLYASGMAWNDIADIQRDRVDAPRRPLPSGRITLVTASIAAVLMSIGALLCAAQVPYGLHLAGAVLCLALLYDLATKDVPWLGSLTMAAVRTAHALFATLILGSDYLLMVVLPDDGGLRHWLTSYPLIIGCYILGLTLVSELESRPARRWELIAGGALMALAVLAVAVRLIGAPWIGVLHRSGGAGPVVMVFGLCAFAALFAMICFAVFRPWWQAVRGGKQHLIGMAVIAGLGGIILIDALAASAAYPMAGLAVLLLYPIFKGVARAIRMD